MSSNLFDALITELGKVVEPLADAISYPRALDGLLAEIGASSENAGGDSLATALSAIVELAGQIEALGGQAQPSIAEIAAVLEAARKVFTAVNELSAAGNPAAALETFGIDLASLLIILYLWNWHPLGHAIAILATVIDPADASDPRPPVVANGNVVRLPFQLERFRFDQLGALVQDPLAALKAAYLTPLATIADANAMADKLFPRVVAVLRGLGVPCRFGFDPADAALLGDSAPFVDRALILYVSDLLDDAPVEGGVIFTLSSADRGGLGLIVTPFGGLAETWQVRSWNLQLDLTAEVQGFAVGGNGFTLLASVGTAEIDAQFTATLPNTSVGPAYVIGTPSGTRIEIGGADFGLQTTLTVAHQSLAVSADVVKSAIVVASSDGDGFLSSVLPQDGLRTEFDLGIAWSSDGGLHFKGAAGLDATLPIGINVGGVFQVPSMHLGLYASTGGVQAEVSASVALSIGPLRALVDRVGVTSDLTSPTGAGNLGSVEFSFAFKLPSGVGLSVDAAGVSGGGFLAHDDATHEYSGVLQLAFTNLALQAFGLITTQVAGGSGYSLLALVDANFPPIQLGWGFTLNGVGGLLAMHRTADADALDAALKADKLTTILFPKNAITNAAQVLGELDVLFPTAQGRFLFGPMALIAWGTPTLLTVALAIVLELPEPIRIILLARLAARLPSESHALVRINVDALGILDLTQKQLSLDATLYDSRLLTYALSGDLSLRADWGTQREFVLAIGGFHPQFTPPPGFPALKRITIDMPSKSIAKMRLAAYLAITSNTVQFGADLDVFIGVGGYGLAGHLGFDALLQLNPFAFKADISATIALMAGGDDLMSVELDGSLSGPGPWTINGSFKIHLLFFDISKSFTYSWGDDAGAQPVAAVDVLALLSAAFADARNWGAQLPASAPALVSTSSADGTSVIAHPLAQLDVHETIVPLGLQIDCIGAAPVSGATTFAITDFRINGSVIQTQPVQEDFAPAQFFKLSDTEKLARPAFEQHAAGVSTIAGLAVAGDSITKSIAYETWYVDTPGGALRSDPAAVLTGIFITDLQAVASIGAAARAGIWSAGSLRYKTAGKPISIAPLQFVVTGTSTLTPAGVGPATGGTYSDASSLMAAALSAAPNRTGQLQIVATYETAAA
jgi:hypothetical protein